MYILFTFRVKRSLLRQVGAQKCRMTPWSKEPGLWGVFFSEKWSLPFLNYLSHEDHSSSSFFLRSLLLGAYFFARMQGLRSGWPLSAPTIAYFWYPQQIGNSFRNWQMMSAFTPGLLRLNKSIASLQHSTLYGIRTIGTKQTCKRNNRASK